MVQLYHVELLVNRSSVIHDKIHLISPSCPGISIALCSDSLPKTSIIPFHFCGLIYLAIFIPYVRLKAYYFLIISFIFYLFIYYFYFYLFIYLFIYFFFFFGGGGFVLIYL